MALTNEEPQAWRESDASYRTENVWIANVVDELLLAREQLTHFTKECWDCKEMQVCEPFEESDYDGGWMVWYCLDTVACKARIEAAKTKRAAKKARA